MVSMLEKYDGPIQVQVFQPTRILTSGNSIELRDWVKDAIATGVSVLLVDCRYVSFMDSSGLGALVSINQTVKQAGCQLRICALQGQARMLLEMTNLYDQFHVYPDVTAARQDLTKSSHVS